MPGRFMHPVPEELDKGEWTVRLGRGLKRCLQSLDASISGLQGTPGPPTRIEAGVAAVRGTAQTPSPSDHAHDVQTAAPSLVLISGAPAEGTGTALVRAGATFVLSAAGGVAGQILAVAAGPVFAFVDDIFTKEYVFLAPGGAVDQIFWRAPFACSVIGVAAYQVGGTPGTINARKNGASEHLAADLATAANAWTASATIQNAGYVSTDYLEFRVKTVAGAPAAIVVQVSFKRT